MKPKILKFEDEANVFTFCVGYAYDAVNDKWDVVKHIFVKKNYPDSNSEETKTALKAVIKQVADNEQRETNPDLPDFVVDYNSHALAGKEYDDAIDSFI